MDAKRKALIEAYKVKPMVGAIYYIECSGNNRKWIKSTKNLDGVKSRFDFAVKTKDCIEPAMRKEWLEYGIESFSFHVVEELKMKDTQTESEFTKTIEERYEKWCKELSF